MLTLRRHGHQPQLEDSTLTPETKALREQFKRTFQLFDPSRYDLDDDTERMARVAWIAYQQGHAAAKAEIAAAVAQERERCIGIIESHHIPVGNSAAGEMACEWTYDALKTIRDAIRAGAKEPSDADQA